MLTPYSIIKNMLWDDYGYTLPDEPSYVTTKIITELNKNGYAIINTVLDDNPSNLEGRESGREYNGSLA